jgi:hypothetical protein
VRETAHDLAALQALLDASRGAAGAHLREVFADDLAVSAAELAERLDGVFLLAVATTSAAGDPISAPVDGILHRGEIHFGTSRDAVRARHLAARPAVTATHIDGERFALVVHGTARPVDLDDPAEAGFRDLLVEVYAPRFGPGWIDWVGTSASYYRIRARRVFASRLPGA